MGWSIGYDSNWKRDIGYGVPAICDLPKCNKEINRGLAFVCGGEPWGGDYGCGLFFCDEHFSYRHPKGRDRGIQNCPRCIRYRPPYDAKLDCEEWIKHKLNDESWYEWRKENPKEVKEMVKQIA